MTHCDCKSAFHATAFSSFSFLPGELDRGRNCDGFERRGLRLDLGTEERRWRRVRPSQSSRPETTSASGRRRRRFGLSISCEATSTGRQSQRHRPQSRERRSGHGHCQRGSVDDVAFFRWSAHSSRRHVPAWPLWRRQTHRRVRFSGMYIIWWLPLKLRRSQRDDLVSVLKHRYARRLIRSLATTDWKTFICFQDPRVPHFVVKKDEFLLADMVGQSDEEWLWVTACSSGQQGWIPKNFVKQISYVDWLRMAACRNTFHIISSIDRGWYPLDTNFSDTTRMFLLLLNEPISLLCKLTNIIVDNQSF